MRGLIVSSGRINRYEGLKLVVKDKDIIVCADGGLNHLMKIGVIPDIVLGDLDSITEEGLKYVEDNKIPVSKYPVEKDATDTELAMEYLIEKGCKEITFAGVTGTRMDHTLGNIFLLDQMLSREIIGIIIDDNNMIEICDDYKKIEKYEGYLSVVPIQQDGAVVTLKGVHYPLTHHHIYFGSTFSISNEIVEDYAEIFVESGRVLVIRSRD